MIKRLDWDSDFFGLEVGVVNAQSFKEIDLTHVRHFDLVYLFFDHSLGEIKNPSGLTLTFVDEKITFWKKTGKISNVENIESIPANTVLSDNITSIAIQSGQYSRFNIDTRIPAGKFQELYRLWIESSVNRSIAKEVFSYLIGDKSAGIITLGMKNGIADIGLLAVDENFRGKNIGSQLIQAAEYWSVNELKCEEIQVVTQGANLQACRFYQKNNFTLVDKKYIYHLWNNTKVV